MKRGRREDRLFPMLGRNSVDNNVAEAQCDLRTWDSSVHLNAVEVI